MNSVAVENKVLNPTLYRKLVHYYGDVEVMSPGIAISWRLVPSRGDDGEMHYSREVDDPGEEYRVCCRCCRDYRPRLYFNHRWGVSDPETKSSNLWLVNCFNENCYSEFNDQLELYQTICGRIGRRGSSENQVRQGRENTGGVIQEIDWPGPVIRLDELAAQTPRHDAVEYLRSRRFDPAVLGKLYGVSFCPSADRYSIASNRIIIPIFHKGMMVGWQARYVGDDVDGVSLKQADVLKYWTSPGFKRRLVAYNFERAIRHDTIVIVEGPADVWRVGPMATALVGKTMSAQLRKSLVHALRNRPNAIVIVALDPEQDAMAKRKKRKHHIDVLCEQLYQPLHGRVVPAWLPEGFDCGAMDRGPLRDLFRQAAAEQGFQASFGRPAA